MVLSLEPRKFAHPPFVITELLIMEVESVSEMMVTVPRPHV
jgi:hypothetical protein